MIEFLSQSDVVLKITEILLGSLIPGIGLLILLLIGKRFIKRLNAATQYAVSFSALIALLAIALVAPLFSLIEFDFGDGPVAEALFDPAEAIELEPVSPRPVSVMDYPELLDEAESENIPNEQVAFQPELIEAAPEEGSTSSEPALNSESSLDETALTISEPEEAIPPTLLQRLGQFKIEIPGTWVPVIFGLWILGVLIFSARLILSLVYLSKLKRNCQPVSGQDERRLNALLEEARIKRAITFCISDQLSMPVAVGFLRPMVIIPNTLRDHLSRKELEQVMMHELAHFKRNDDWAKLIQQLVQIPLFFHPTLMWLLQTLDFTREVACDDWLIARRNVQRESYSESLCKVAEWSLDRRTPQMSLGLAASRSQIERRIKLLLDKQREIFAGIKRGRWLILSAVIAIAAYALISNAPNIGFYEVAVASENQEVASVDESGTQPVMYEHLIYRTGIADPRSSEIFELRAPLGAGLFWENIERISLPEMSNVVLHLDSFGDDVNFEEQISISLDLRDWSAGKYQVSKIHAQDQEGRIWEVPIGTIQLDLRENALFETEGITLGCASAKNLGAEQMGSFSSFGYLGSNVFYSFDGQDDYEFVEYSWGEELLSEHFEIALLKRNSPNDINPVRVELPLSPQGDEQLIVALYHNTAQLSPEFITEISPTIGYMRSNSSAPDTLLYGTGCAGTNSVYFTNLENLNSFTPIDITGDRGGGEGGFGALNVQQASNRDLAIDPETGEVLAVAYKYNTYQAVGVNSESRIGFGVPVRAHGWWTNIESLSLPEHPNLVLTDFQVTTPDPRQSSNSSIGVNAAYIPMEVGTLSTTLIHALDREGQLWEIPIGEYFIDVRDDIIESGTLVDRCELGEFHEDYLDFVRNNRIFETVFGAPAGTSLEITRIEWGQDLLSNADQDLAYELNAIDVSTGNSAPIELPYQLSGDEALQFVLSLARVPGAIDGRDQAIDPDGIYASSFFVEYRDVENSESVSVSELAPTCARGLSSGSNRDYVNATPISGESAAQSGTGFQDVSESNSSQPVLLKHHIYHPMNTGIESRLWLSAPMESETWWRNITSVSFVDAPGINVVLNRYTLFPYARIDYANSVPLQLRLHLTATQQELRKVRTLRAIDVDGNVWDVPVGQLVLDVQDGESLAQRGSSFALCNSASTERWGSLGSVTVEEFFNGPENPPLPFNMIASMWRQHTGTTPIELLSVSWGEENFADFDVSEIAINARPQLVSEIEEITLPHRFEPESLVQLIFNIQDEDALAVVSSSALFEYRILEGDFAGQVIQEAVQFCSYAPEDQNSEIVTHGAIGRGLSPEASEAQYPQVMLKNRMYRPLFTDAESDISFFAPHGSEDWWSQIESINFPEAPDVRVTGFRLAHMLSDEQKAQPEFRFIQTFSVIARVMPSFNSPGRYTITHLHATDVNGAIWRVPLGELVWDIYSSDRLTLSPENLEICPLDVGSGFQNNTYPEFEYALNVSMFTPIEGAEVEILNVFWGGEFMSHSESAPEFELAAYNQNLTQRSSIQLPYVATSGELITASLNVLPGIESTFDSVWQSLIFVEFRDLALGENSRSQYIVPGHCANSYFAQSPPIDRFRPSPLSLGQMQQAVGALNSPPAFQVSENQAVFLCSLTEGGQSLCTYDFETGALLPVSLPNNGQLHPIPVNLSFNQFGQIVYECWDSIMIRETRLCVTESESESVRVLHDLVDVDLNVRWAGPSINSHGQIAFSCGTGAGDSLRENLCVINFDGTGYSQILDAPTEFSPSGFGGPDINDLGQIVFSCLDQTDGPLFSQSDICLINSDGTDFRVLVDNIDGSETWFENTNINSSGQIAFICRFSGDESRRSSICTMNAEDEDYQVIHSTPQQNHTIQGLELTEEGQILFSCVTIDAEGLGNEFDLCSINFDGSDFEVLLDDVNGDEIPNYGMPNIQNS